MYYTQHVKTSYNDFFAKVMKWLTIALYITTMTSILLDALNIPTLLLSIYTPMIFILCVIELLMVFVLHKKVSNMDFNSAKICFYIYSVINGVTLSVILSIVGTGIASIAFLMTAAYFGLLYTIAKNSKTDFASTGKICIAMLPILIICYIFLLFIHAPVVYYIVTLVDLIIFTGLTLYDMKKMQRLYEHNPSEKLEGIALICALELYLDFINIFIDILRLISDNN